MRWGPAASLERRIDDAQQLAERALGLSQAQKERGSQAWALRIVAAVASHRDPPQREQAAKYYGGDDPCHWIGMRPLVAHCHLALAKLYWRTDKHEQAEDHLITATTMYGDLGMTYWLERSEREVPRVE